LYAHMSNKRKKILKKKEKKKESYRILKQGWGLPHPFGSDT
jgi:hypothetical protein